MANVYLEIEEIIRSIFTSLSTDEDFIKLMTNDAPTALTDANTVTLNDLVDMKRINILPKKLDPNEHQGSYAFIYFNDDSYAGANNTYQRNLTFVFSFVCHSDVWGLDNWKVRPYRLLYTIREGLKKANVSEQALRGKITLGSSRKIDDGHYMGYNISFEITGSDSSCA